MTRIKPPALPDGGTIAVVAPSSPPQIRSEIEQATDYFTKLRLQRGLRPALREVHGYLAGIDEHRAADLQWALSEPGIDMVHLLQGGYGAARLYPRIDWDALGDPRIVCGFSDITALHLALAKHGPWTTFYGPTFTRFTRRKDELTRRDEGVVPPRLQARAARPRVRGSREPVRADRRRRQRRGADRRRLHDARVPQHRHAVRDRDRRLHPHDRGPQRGALHGRRAACTT